MRPFAYQTVTSAADAIAAARGANQAGHSGDQSGVAYLAGGTTLLDLMKLDVMRPSKVVDINRLPAKLAQVEFAGNQLRLGALAHMSDVAANADIVRNAPVLAQSLLLAASGQLRNMATLGGNVLQRTRCPYFRDPSWQACNKRNPGSGCAALSGVNRTNAILGVSDSCIATYAGDFGQALIALDAVVEIHNSQGMRALPFAQLHRRPAATPHIETSLAPGDLITGFHIVLQPWMRRSTYIKVRDRQSYAFALASAAVALDLQNNVVREARIALGGVSATPWRAREAEAALRGKQLDPSSAAAAATIALSGATPHDGNAFKRELGERTLVRALLTAQALEI